MFSTHKLVGRHFNQQFTIASTPPPFAALIRVGYLLREQAVRSRLPLTVGRHAHSEDTAQGIFTAVVSRTTVPYL